MRKQFINRQSLKLCLAAVSICANLQISAHGSEEHHEIENTTDSSMPAEKPADAEIYHKAALDEFPTLHPMVVHFPIVLLLLALLMQSFGLFLFKRELSWVVLVTIAAGLAGAYVAGSLVHPHAEGLTEQAAWVLQQHEKYADFTLWLSALALLGKLTSHFPFRQKIWSEMIVALVLAAAAFTVSTAGHLGAQLLHIEGVGAKGQFLKAHDHKEKAQHGH